VQIPRQDPGISRFFLYGEPPRPVESRFVHLEDLEDRSRPSNWIIRAHSHADLHHIFHFTAGGGELIADGKSLRYEAPCIAVIPALTVHGINHIPESEGSVLTFADSYLRSLALDEPGFSEIYAEDAWVAATEDDALGASLARLARELSWAAPGHAAAVDAHLTVILVEALRLFHHIGSKARQAETAQRRLVARFRQLIEAHYRQTRDIAHYAERLGVPASRLRGACRAITGRAPTQMLHDRLALEARRIMHYSDMSISEIGYYLGFEDPAYFSRFTTKALGVSPRGFRAQAQRRSAP
jgi:AraC family transcriptional regulator, transcriptional activator of pobA